MKILDFAREIFLEETLRVIISAIETNNREESMRLVHPHNLIRCVISGGGELREVFEITTDQSSSKAISSTIEKVTQSASKMVRDWDSLNDFSLQLHDLFFGKLLSSLGSEKTKQYSKIGGVIDTFGGGVAGKIMGILLGAVSSTDEPTYMEKLEHKYQQYIQNFLKELVFEFDTSIGPAIINDFAIKK